MYDFGPPGPLAPPGPSGTSISLFPAQKQGIMYDFDFSDFPGSGRIPKSQYSIGLRPTKFKKVNPGSHLPLDFLGPNTYIIVAFWAGKRAVSGKSPLFPAQNQGIMYDSGQKIALRAHSGNGGNVVDFLVLVQGFIANGRS